MFKKIVKKQIISLIFIILILQSFLISHRVSFEFPILFNFYKSDTGIEKSVKNRAAINITNYLLHKNLKDFFIDESLINNDNFSQRIVEFSYPIKFDKNSKNVISKKKLNNCLKIFQFKDVYVYNCK